MLRSIKKAHELICLEAPDTTITVHTIRIWCKKNKIKHLMAGSRVLVDVESLTNYINQAK